MKAAAKLAGSAAAGGAGAGAAAVAQAEGRPPAARQRLLDTASRLFYQHGIRAIGIDTIIEQSGCAKMSLYRHFATKDELVVAYLELRSQTYWEWFERTLARRPHEPREQLRDLAAAIERQALRPDYRGCPFLNVAVEFPEPEHPAHAVATAYKREMQRRLADLARRAGAREPEALAAQLNLLIDGARLAAQVSPQLYTRGSLARAFAALLVAELHAAS